MLQCRGRRSGLLIRPAEAGAHWFESRLNPENYIRARPRSPARRDCDIGRWRALDPRATRCRSFSPRAARTSSPPIPSRSAACSKPRRSRRSSPTLPAAFAPRLVLIATAAILQLYARHHPNVVRQELFLNSTVACRRELTFTNCPRACARQLPGQRPPGLGGIELNETVRPRPPLRGAGPLHRCGRSTVPCAPARRCPPPERRRSSDEPGTISTSGTDRTERSAPFGCPRRGASRRSRLPRIESNRHGSDT